MSNLPYSRRREPHFVYRFFDQAGRLLYVGCTRQQRCLDAFRLNGGTATIDTICEHFHRLGVWRDRGPLSRRLTDLASAGLITDTGTVVRGSRGRDVTVWRLA